MTRWDASTDANHKLIAETFRRCGASVHNTHRVGGGFADLCVGIEGINLLMEVKTATGKLNANEEKFHNEWRGQIKVVRTVEEAVRLAERWRNLGHALGELAREMEARMYNDREMDE